MYAISIDLGDGRKLVAGTGCDPNFKEIFIGIEHADGIYQDLCMAGEQYECEKDSFAIIPKHGEYRVLLWEDETTDACTKEIYIKGYTGEE